MNVLIIRPGALGDTLLLLPALVSLSRQMAVTFVGRQPGLDFLRDHVYRALDLEGGGWHRLFMKRPDGKTLPVSKTDLVVAFFADNDGCIRRNLELYFPRVPVTVFPSFPPHVAKVHVARHLLNGLKLAGLPIDTEKSLEAASRGSLLGRGVEPRGAKDSILIHPGSGDPKKNHRPGFWLEVLLRLGSSLSFRGLKRGLLLGPAEEGLYAYFQENLQSTREEIHFCPNKEQLTGLLGKSALYLGQDSGITHLAAFFGIPTVALFKASNVSQWRPLGPKVRVIEDERGSPELAGRLVGISSSLVHLYG